VVVLALAVSWGGGGSANAEGTGAEARNGSRSGLDGRTGLGALAAAEK
jgi:hypothetical protein